MPSGKIRVFLRLGARPHPVYRTLLSNPPKGVEYLHPPVAHYSESVSLGHRLKVAAWNAYQSVFPPVAAFNPMGGQLIHSTNNTFVANKMPWVMDTESAEGFAGFRRGGFAGISRRIIRHVVSSPNCKAVMPWSDAANQAIKNALPYPEITGKLRTVRPAIPLSKSSGRKKSSKRFELLFVGRVFYEKGGREVLAAYDILRRRSDIGLTMVSNVPSDLAAKYASDRNLRILPPTQTSAQMDALYEKADAFVFPTYMDTFGAVILEAMSHGLPVVSTRCYCVPEMIEHGKSGLLLSPPITWHDSRNLYRFSEFPKWENFVQAVRATDTTDFSCKLAAQTKTLVDDGRLCRRLSANARKAIASGPFSIRRRNAELSKIYSEAIQ